MKFIFLTALLFLNICYAEIPKEIVMGFVPGENPEKIKKSASDFAQFLEKKLNVQVEVFVPSNYDGLVTAMADKKIDFGFFSALTFVEAEKKAHAKVLLKKVWKSPYYYSALVVLKKSAIKSIEGLKNKKIGFVDEKSASGFLYPKAMFLKKGIKPEKYFSEIKFYGNHEATIDALFKNKVDAVAVFSDDAKGQSGAWLKNKNYNKNINILWLSEPIPNDPLCVREDFYEKYPRYTHDLMFTLIDMQDNPEEKELLKHFIGADSLALATSRQYDPVRELIKYTK
ncbi:MAG: phosphate/phosphite/phosphonate ABC transporter substrate-binding protein [Oligoflexia bacterium]|nr:phosphate/phosphite/phosphonate ABC transporter substrate-binding protein [Oligoflexia bacterium]